MKEVKNYFNKFIESLRNLILTEDPSIKVEYFPSEHEGYLVEMYIHVPDIDILHFSIGTERYPTLLCCHNSIVNTLFKREEDMPRLRELAYKHIDVEKAKRVKELKKELNELTGC